MIAVLARSTATVAIAAGLVFAVPVAAQAYVLPSPTVAGEMVLGAVRAAAPRVVTAASFAGRVTPWGTLFTVGQLAYMTRDSWMPWISNEFGAGGTTSVNGSGNQLISWAPNFNTTSPTSIDVWMTQVTNQGNATQTTSWQCKDPTTGATGNGGNSVQSGAYSVGQSWAVHVGGCPLGQNLNSVVTQSFKNGLPNSNQLTWGVAFDPQTEGTYRVSMDCEKTDGTVVTISSDTTSPGGGGLAVPSCAAAFPGSHGVKMLVDGGRIGSPLVKQYQADWARTSVLYPNCVGAGVACSYVLRYNNIPCVAGQTECIGWALKQDTEPDKYECWYGPYQLLLSECTMLERVYEPNGTTLTKLNTDGDPRTYDVTDPNGNPVPGLVPGGTPAPAPAPAKPPAGAPGGDPAPVPPGDPSPTPAPSGDPNTNDCWPSGGAAWNPAAWVLTPVKCALKWAFVPSSSWMDGYGNGFRAKWEATPPGKWITAAGGLVPVIASGGCQGPALPTGFLGEGRSFENPGGYAVLPAEIHPFDACSAPMSTVAATSNLILSAGIAFYGGMKVVRQLGYAFGFQVHVGSERSTFT